MIPKNFRLVYDAASIASRVEKLGREITGWATEVCTRTGGDLVAVPVLRGGIFFFADLVRQISASVEIAPVQTWAYVEALNATARDAVAVELGAVPAKGRSVLLVDDVCDSGKTLVALQNAFLSAGALEVRSAVLVKRRIKRPIFHPEWVGFEYAGPEWFVGYGMEDADRWRNLPEVYVMQKSQN